MRAAGLTIAVCCAGLLFILSGCAVVDTVGFFTPEKPPFDEQISEGYERIELKKSSSADVLSMICLPEYEMLSQSKSVIASLGQKKKGYKTWLKMAAFDENELTARRKYLMAVDERPKFLFVEPWAGLEFDCETVLEKDVIDKPYSNENARRIAIMRQVSKNVRGDIAEVKQDNKMIDVSGMLINQALATVLVKLDGSPVLAAKLNGPDGIEFEHTSFDKGKVWMVVGDDVVTVKIMLGSLVKKKADLSRLLRVKQGGEAKDS